MHTPLVSCAQFVDRLVALVTEAVVVHGDGRSVRGRKELKQDFLKGFAAFSIEPSFWGILGGSATILFFALFLAFVAYSLLRFSFRKTK